ELDREKHHALVQRVEMLEAVEEGMRRGFRRSREEDRRARRALRRIAQQRFYERPELHRVLTQALEEDLPAAAPGDHDHEDPGTQGEREPAALVDLEQR